MDSTVVVIVAVVVGIGLGVALGLFVRRSQIEGLRSSAQAETDRASGLDAQLELMKTQYQS
jgi:hypothetical protein